MDSERDMGSHGTADPGGQHPADRSGSADPATKSPAPSAPGGPAPGGAPPSTGGPSEGGAVPTEEVGAEAGAALGETPKERRARKARRIRLYVYVFVALAVVAYLIALGAANTASVDVSWVFGTSAVPLVWLVLSAAVLGFTLGILVSLLIRWRTRRRKKTEE